MRERGERLDRRRLVGGGLALAAGFAVGGLNRSAAGSVHFTVHKMPGCSCCERWAGHIRAAGFTATVREASDLDAVRRRAGIPKDLWGCHTSLAGDLVVEGHVPAEAIRRFLDDRQGFLGLAVPGMPVGSPGMEGTPEERYEVVAFKASGERSVFMRF